MRIKCRCESCGRDWYVDSSLNGKNQLGCPYCILTRNLANQSKADKFEASCITVGLFDTDSGVKRCEHGAQSAECLQRAA